MTHLICYQSMRCLDCRFDSSSSTFPVPWHLSVGLGRPGVIMPTWFHLPGDHQRRLGRVCSDQTCGTRQTTTSGSTAAPDRCFPGRHYQMSRLFCLFLNHSACAVTQMNFENDRWMNWRLWCQYHCFSRYLGRASAAIAYCSQTADARCPSRFPEL